MQRRFPTALGAATWVETVHRDRPVALQRASSGCVLPAALPSLEASQAEAGSAVSAGAAPKGGPGATLLTERLLVALPPPGGVGASPAGGGGLGLCSSAQAASAPALRAAPPLPAAAAATPSRGERLASRAAQARMAALRAGGGEAVPPQAQEAAGGDVRL